MIEKWIDKYGLLCDINSIGHKDQGDCLSTEGCFWTSWHLTPAVHKANRFAWFNRSTNGELMDTYREEFRVMKLLKYGWGRLRRGCDESQWSGEKTQLRLSREQIECWFCWQTAALRIPECREVFKFLFLRACLFSVILSFLLPLWLAIPLGFMIFPFMRRNGATKDNHGQMIWAPEGGKEPDKLNSFEKFIIKYRIPFIPVNENFRNYNLRLPDLVGPEFWALALRGCRYPCTYYIVWLLDIHSFFAALKDYRDYEKGKYDNDSKVRLMKGIIQDFVWPTTWTDQANEFLTHTDPQVHLDAFYDNPKRNRARCNEFMRWLVLSTFRTSRARPIRT